MNDEALLALFFRRDERALSETAEAHGKACRAIANNLLGSAEDAEECWNDALFRAWNAIPPERPLRLRAYLAKLTRAAAIDRLRERNAAKRGGGAYALILDELAECVPGGENPADAAETKALGEAVSRFLRTLPQREREIFIRRCFYGDAPGEIARRLGMRANSVAVSLRRTRQKMRAALKKEGMIP